MHVNKLVFGLVVATALAGCGGTSGGGAPSGTPAPAASAPADQTAKIAAIAAEIKADPDGYDAILAKHGMTSAELEKALYGIASDPEKSAAYEKAMQ